MRLENMVDIKTQNKLARMAHLRPFEMREDVKGTPFECVVLAKDFLKETRKEAELRKAARRTV